MDQFHLILGSESLKDITLSELNDKIDEASDEELSCTTMLHSYMAWLNERLQVINNSDQEVFTQEIAKWCTTMGMRGYNDTTILDGFEEWRSDHLSKEPSSSRRLNLAGLELHTLFQSPFRDRAMIARRPIARRPERSTSGSHSPSEEITLPFRSASSAYNPAAQVHLGEPNLKEREYFKPRPSSLFIRGAAHDDIFGNMHPDRLPFAENHKPDSSHPQGNTGADMNDNTDNNFGDMHTDRVRLSTKSSGEDGYAEHMDIDSWGAGSPHSDQVRVIDLDLWERPVIEISSDHSEIEDEDEDAKSGEDGSFFFLSGANRMIFGQNMESKPHQEPVARSKASYSRPPKHSRKAKKPGQGLPNPRQTLQDQTPLRKRHLPVPRDYICNRCGVSGELLVAPPSPRE